MKPVNLSGTKFLNLVDSGKLVVVNEQSYDRYVQELIRDFPSLNGFSALNLPTTYTSDFIFTMRDESRLFTLLAKLPIPFEDMLFINSEELSRLNESVTDLYGLTSKSAEQLIHYFIKPFSYDLSPVHAALSLLKIKGSYHIHPRVEAEVLFASHFSQELHLLEVDDVNYLFVTPENFAPHDSKTAIKVLVNDHNIWHLSLVNLYEWEWLFLIHGADAVNKKSYYEYSSGADDEERMFFTEETKALHIEYTRSKFSDPIAYDPDFFDEEDVKVAVAQEEAKFKPAKINHSGFWIVAQS